MTEEKYRSYLRFAIGESEYKVLVNIGYNLIRLTEYAALCCFDDGVCNTKTAQIIRGQRKVLKDRGYFTLTDEKE